MQPSQENFQQYKVKGKKKIKNIRWLIVSLAFLGIFINYVDRANLSVALPYMQEELNISPGAAGLILGAFFWTYAPFQLPAGWLADKLGARIMFTVAAAWWSIFTAFTALSRGFLSLMSLRLLLGIGEAGAFPSATKTVSRWFPKQERAFASGIYNSGARVGTALALPIVTAIIAYIGWKASFIITGGLGIIWAIVWFWFYRDPREHPNVSQEELDYIEEGGADTFDQVTKVSDTDKGSIRWRDLFRYKEVWGITIGYSCISFIMYFFITWFPTYLVDSLGFSLLEVGIYGVIPGIAALIGQLAGGYVSDSLVRRGVSITKARKGCIIGGTLFSTVIGLAAFVDSPIFALVLLSISFASVTFADGSIWALPADISPKEKNWSASIAGIQNSFSNIAGIASPAIIGLLVGLTGSFAAGLIVSGVVAIIGSLIFIFMVGEIKPLDPLKLK
jgi:ACS family glucarate transporter-like MFS transporter